MPAVWSKIQAKETACDFSVATKTNSDLMQVINCPGAKSSQGSVE